METTKNVLNFIFVLLLVILSAIIGMYRSPGKEKIMTKVLDNEKSKVLIMPDSLLNENQKKIKYLIEIEDLLRGNKKELYSFEKREKKNLNFKNSEESLTLRSIKLENKILEKKEKEITKEIKNTLYEELGVQNPFPRWPSLLVLFIVILCYYLTKDDIEKREKQKEEEDK